MLEPQLEYEMELWRVSKSFYQAVKLAAPVQEKIIWRKIMILRASATTVRTKRLAEEEIENLNQSLAILYHFERHKITYMGGLYDARSYNLLSEMKDIFDNSFITLARRHREGLFTKMYIKSMEE